MNAMTGQYQDTNTLTIRICFQLGRGSSEIVTRRITQEQRILGEGLYRKVLGRPHFVV
jgi:hypothetical protein